jgi:low molecular weight protein-tyrosine phosphatase
VVARQHLQRAGLAVEVASAGTEDYHVGAAADRRAISSARAAGYDLAAHRARQVSVADFEEFDHLLAMDHVNLRALRNGCPVGLSHKLELFLRHAMVAPPDEVPDPYYGGAADFRKVIDLAEAGAQGLIARLR